MTLRTPLDPLVLAEEQRRAATLQIAGPAAPIAERRADALKANGDIWQHVGRPAPQTETSTWTVPVADAPDVRVRLHRPPGVSGPLPGVIALFGGAFRQGNIDYPSFDAAVRNRCVGARVAVLAVDYALAPEHPWPHALEQVYAVIDEVARTGEQHGIDAARLAITGASAGGNLAAAACLANRDRANHPLALQLLEVPALDLTGGEVDRSVLSDLGRSAEAVEADLGEVVAMYTAGADPRNPLVSPLFAESLAGLPPAYLMAASLDPLVGDSRAYVARLSADGTPASLLESAGQTHDSNSFTGISLSARHWEASVVAVLASLHEPPQ